MRIIFFNIWYGRVSDKFQKFIDQQKENTDIFAFVEANFNIQNKLKETLFGFNNIYYEGYHIDYFGGVNQGLSIFIKKEIEIKKHSFNKLFKPTINDAGGFTTSLVSKNKNDFWLGLVHGQASPGSKLDTAARISQSENIIGTFQNVSEPIIIGGDFNLSPNTESIKLIENAGYRNLIKEFKITQTRNQLCWDQFPEEVARDGKQYFADYCFVSPDVKVKNFSVPNVEVSDHEPLILDFEV